MTGNVIVGQSGGPTAAINSSLAKKLCLLVPDDYSVDGDTIGNFIRLAFLNENDLTTKVNLIRYYPDTEINRVSEFKSGYHTFFHEDQIGNNLDNAISCFLANDDEQKVVRFINNPYGKPLKKSGNISYHSYNHEKTVSVFIHVDALKPQLLALLFNSEVYSEIRKDKRIFEHVNYLERVYSSILKTTLEFLDGKDYKDYRLQIHLTDTDCDLKQAIGYYLYLLQAAGLLSLVQVNRTDRSLRRIAFSNMLISYKSEFSDYITTVKTTEFGGAFR